MTTRLPNTKYLGDGCYASHDGYQIVLETSDGVTVKNRIGLESGTLEALNQYVEYVRGFYQTGQHQAPPGCEECGKNLSDPNSPLQGPVLAEIYRVSHEGKSYEIRLCNDCAQAVDEEFLEYIIRKRDQRAQPLP